MAKAIAELRALSKSLDKEWLERFNFIQNLKVEASRINSAGNLQIMFSHPQEFLLKSDKQIILFRIVQEAIQNAIKHAQAKIIQINLLVSNEIIKINITDDGIGFDKSLASEGLGIMNMKHRTKLLDGKIAWNSAGKGSQVTIEVPFKKMNNENSGRNRG